jgi:hypothetical protein
MTSIEEVQAAMDAPGVSKTRKQKLKQRLKKLQVLINFLLTGTTTNLMDSYSYLGTSSSPKNLYLGFFLVPLCMVLAFWHASHNRSSPMHPTPHALWRNTSTLKVCRTSKLQQQGEWNRSNL